MPITEAFSSLLLVIRHVRVCKSRHLLETCRSITLLISYDQETKKDTAQMITNRTKVQQEVCLYLNTNMTGGFSWKGSTLQPEEHDNMTVTQSWRRQCRHRVVTKKTETYSQQRRDKSERISEAKQRATVDLRTCDKTSTYRGMAESLSLELQVWPKTNKENQLKQIKPKKAMMA